MLREALSRLGVEVSQDGGSAAALPNETAKPQVLDESVKTEIRRHLGERITNEAVSQALSSMRETILAWLGKHKQILYGKDSLKCGSGDAYAVNNSGNLAICDSFFDELSSTNQVLTLIHESAHSLPANNLFDVYKNFRLFKHLSKLPGNKEAVNPDSLAALVDSIGQSHHQSLGKIGEAPATWVNGGPARSEDNVVAQDRDRIDLALAWAEAKVDAAQGVLDQAIAMQSPIASDRVSISTALAFSHAASILDIEVQMSAPSDMVSLSFDKDDTVDLHNILTILAEKFKRSITASMSHMSKVAKWEDGRLTLPLWESARANGRRWPKFTPSLVKSPLQLSSDIIDAMVQSMVKDTNRSYVRFIDAVFKADNRMRGAWAETL